MSQAHNRIAAYHCYLGSAFCRERREHIILTVQKVFIDHHALASARDTAGANVAPDRRAAPAIGRQHLHPCPARSPALGAFSAPRAVHQCAPRDVRVYH